MKDDEKEKIKIIYIDDMPDTDLESYLDDNYQNDDYEYETVVFDPSQNYVDMLNTKKIREANIVFLDSVLFERQVVTDVSFKGEEFAMVLKKQYPFIEVIPITQNRNPEIPMVDKYSSSGASCSAAEYYKKVIGEEIAKATIRIKQYAGGKKELEDNKIWEKYLKENILTTFNGDNLYDGLSKDDITRLVNAFKELQEKINEL